MKLIKQGSTFFLRAVTIGLGLIVLALCIFALPQMWHGGSAEFPTASQAVFLIMLGLYATTIPFYLALGETLKLLRYIDENKGFSTRSINAIRRIKLCASVIAVLYVGGVPLLFPIAEADDAPGLLLMGAVIACAPITVAVFAAVLQKLLQSAIELKSENELTI